MKRIYLGAGCLWGVQEYLNRIPGVVNTAAGILNSDLSNSKEQTGIEVVLVEYICDTKDLLTYFKHLVQTNNSKEHKYKNIIGSDESINIDWCCVEKVKNFFYSKTSDNNYEVTKNSSHYRGKLTKL